MYTIGNAYSLERAESSQAYAYKCWYNYNYEENTMRIPAEDMQSLTETWKNELNNWRATAEQDTNAYEIEDDDWSSIKLEQLEESKEEAGHDGTATGSKIYAGTETPVSTFNAGTAIAGAAGVGLNSAILGSKVTTKLAAAGAKKAAEKAGAEALKNAAGKSIEEAAKASTEAAGNASAKSMAGQTKGGWMISAPLSMALGILYTTLKPNKKEKESLDQLMNDMITTHQQALNSAQNTLINTGNEVVDLSETAQGANEEFNAELEKKQDLYETAMLQYQGITERIKNGESLTDSEKAQYESIGIYLEDLGLEIQTLQTTAQETIEETAGDIDSKQDTYDEQAGKMATVEAITDFAAGFDKATRTLCLVEGASQTLNAVTGTVAAVQAGIAAAASMGMNAYAWACVGMGTAGAVMSGIGAAEQFKWAAEIGKAIDIRESIQELNTQTMSVYDSTLSNYATDIDTVSTANEDVNTALDDFEFYEPDSAANITAAESTGEDDKNKDKKENETPVQSSNLLQNSGFGSLTGTNTGEQKKNPFM